MKTIIATNVNYSNYDANVEIKKWERRTNKKVRKAYLEPVKNSTKFNLVVEGE